MKHSAHALVTVVAVFAASCSAEPGAPPPADNADASADPDGRTENDASSSIACNYTDPPRCGPRGCVAMCVTCFYDRCRVAGGSCADCMREMEFCKYWCARPPY